ncbi:MAG: biotin/lipoyl-containing protein [Ardenticatenales bacterium]
MKYKATVDQRDFTLDVDRPGELIVDGENVSVDLMSIDGENLYSLLVDGVSYDLHVERREGLYTVIIEGDRYTVDVGDAHLKELIAMSRRGHEEHGGAVIKAPMPGLVVKVLVAPGDAVAADQPVAILEAMKMENELRNPAVGIVKQVNIVPGQTVNMDDVLIVVAPPEVETVDSASTSPAAVDVAAPPEPAS